MHNVIKLYKKDSKDRIRVWYGKVDGDEVVTRSGVLDGKLKEERRRATPKNVGNANETTGEAQALLELESKVNKERDKGYFDTIEEVEGNVVALPMLAHPYDKRKKYITYPAIVQPKLDGVRAMVQLNVKTGAVRDPISRKGKSFARMDNLEDDLLDIVEKLPESVGDIKILTGVDLEEIWLDGELFSDQIPFE